MTYAYFSHRFEKIIMVTRVFCIFSNRLEISFRSYRPKWNQTGLKFKPVWVHFGLCTNSLWCIHVWTKWNFKPIWKYTKNTCNHNYFLKPVWKVCICNKMSEVFYLRTDYKSKKYVFSFINNLKEGTFILTIKVSGIYENDICFLIKLMQTLHAFS